VNVALYSRVSTTEQETQLQTDEIRAFVAARGWTVVAQETDNASGAKDKRPGLDRVMKLAKARKIDVVVVQSLDRFARSLKHLVTALDELHELRVQFVSTSEGFDLTTASGRAMYGMIGVMAEFERAMIRERVTTGLAKARREGKTLGRPGVKPDAKKLEHLVQARVSERAMAKALGCSRTAVRTAIRALNL